MKKYILNRKLKAKLKEKLSKSTKKLKNKKSKTKTKSKTKGGVIEEPWFPQLLPAAPNPAIYTLF